MSASLTLVDHYVVAYPAEVARYVERTGTEQAAAFVAGLSAARAAELMAEVAPAVAADIVGALPGSALAELDDRVSADDWATWLRRCDPEDASRVLAALPEATAESVRLLMQYAPDTVGAAVDPATHALPATVTTGEALELLARRSSVQSDPVFAISASHRLAGRVDLQRLRDAPADTPLEDVTSHTPWLAAGATLLSVATHPGWRDADALPVAGEQQRFVGALTHRRLRQRLDHQAPSGGDERVARTVIALGEIYWLGLCGLLQGIAETAAEPIRSGSESES